MKYKNMKLNEEMNMSLNNNDVDESKKERIKELKEFLKESEEFVINILKKNNLTEAEFLLLKNTNTKKSLH